MDSQVTTDPRDPADHVVLLDLLDQRSVPWPACMGWSVQFLYRNLYEASLIVCDLGLKVLSVVNKRSEIGFQGVVV